MPETPSPRFARHELACALADMRLESGWPSQTSVAEEIGVRQQTLASIENERTVPSEENLTDLLRLYGHEDELAYYGRLREIAKQSDPQWRGVDLSAEPKHFDDYVEYEAQASHIDGYEMRLVPGLLQTRQYAELVLRTDHLPNTGLQRKVDIRLRRQNLLTRQHAPARLRMVIEEHALDHPAAEDVPARVMRDQYAHLLELSTLDNVELQICPRAVGAHEGMTTSFVALRFASPRVPPLVAIELEIMTLFLERPTEVKQYTSIRDALARLSLPPKESAVLLNKKRREV